MRLRGPGGVTVEAVSFTDKAGHRRRLYRVRKHGVHLGDFASTEALGTVVDLATLVEDDEGGS